MGNIIHVDFKERQIANIKLNQIKFLTKHLPYIKARQKQLKERGCRYCKQSRCALCKDCLCHFRRSDEGFPD